MLVEKQLLQHQYLSKLTKKAVSRARDQFHSDPQSVLFDPQGRILIDVPLSEEDKKLFKEAMGRNPSAITTVSLDITGIPELYAIYKHQYGLTENLINQLKNIEGSIIPLHEEFYFHLSLAARVYCKIAPEKFKENQMNQAFQRAMKRVNQLVIIAYKSALENPEFLGKLNTGVIIRELDKSRGQLVSTAHRILAEEIVRATGIRLSKTDLNLINIKQHAVVTTATPNDVLHTHRSLNQMTWIAGSDVSAHDRGLGADHLADRQILTFPLQGKLQTKPRLQIRIPSLDVKDNISSLQAIKDVSDKLRVLNSKYELDKVIEPNAIGQRAFIYNLYTAINDNLEGAHNKQSQGARYILAGAHDYNVKQLALHKDAPVFCLVQNISINGFGDTLGYDGNSLRKEATLMSELAVIHTLTEVCGMQLDNVNLLFEKYKNYLTKPLNEREKFFSESQEGKEAIHLIHDIKEAWLNEQAVNTDNLSLHEQALQALKVMFKNDLHHHHRFAKLFQAISVFIESVSLGGCKSANERAQAINGRVAMLESAAHHTHSPIRRSMNHLVCTDKEEIFEDANHLKSMLNIKYDSNLQSAAALISKIDQGSAAKVKAKKGATRLYDRNCAEEETLSNLYQEHAGAMQAHKGLSKYITQAWIAPKPMGYWSFLYSKVGSVGTVLCTIFFPVAYPIVTYFHRKYIREVQNQFEKGFIKAEKDYHQAKVQPNASPNLMHEKIIKPSDVVKARVPPSNKQNDYTEHYKQVLEFMNRSKNEKRPPIDLPQVQSPKL